MARIIPLHRFFRSALGFCGAGFFNWLCEDRHAHSHPDGCGRQDCGEPICQHIVAARRTKAVSAAFAPWFRPGRDDAWLWRVVFTSPPTVWAWIAADPSGRRVLAYRDLMYRCFHAALVAAGIIPEHAHLPWADHLHLNGDQSPARFSPHGNYFGPAAAYAWGRIIRLPRRLPRSVARDVERRWRAGLADLTGIAMPPRLAVRLDGDRDPSRVKVPPADPKHPRNGPPTTPMDVIAATRKRILLRELRGFPGWRDVPGSAIRVIYRGALSGTVKAAAEAALEVEEAERRAALGLPAEELPEPQKPIHGCPTVVNHETGERCGKKQTLFANLPAEVRQELIDDSMILNITAATDAGVAVLRRLAAAGEMLSGYGGVTPAEVAWHVHETDRAADPSHASTCPACRRVEAALERDRRRETREERRSLYEQHKDSAWWISLQIWQAWAAEGRIGKPTIPTDPVEMRAMLESMWAYQYRRKAAA